MRILLLTEGSRGDIEPFLALAVALKKTGYDVIFSAGKNFADMVGKTDVSFREISVDYQEIMKSGEIGSLHGKNLFVTFLRSWRNIKRRFVPVIRQTLHEAWQVASDADAIIYHPKSLAGYHIAEKKKIPAFLFLPTPLLVPTKEFPLPLLPFDNCGALLNKVSYNISKLLLLSYHNVINKWRKDELGLRRKSFFDSYLHINGNPIPVIHEVSQSVIACPADWPDHAVMPGYFFLDHSAWMPPDDLVSFLAAGPPPVYISFGSMGYSDPQGLTQTVVEAVRQAGQRAVIAIGWGAMAVPESADDIFCVEHVPYSWLFPQVSAVVIHGGAGSVAAGLRAGRPVIVCPFFSDQPFWGKIVAAHHAGPQPIPIKQLTSEKLAGAIRQCLDDQHIKQSAAVLGEKIRSEDGLGKAVAYIRDAIGQYS